MGSQNPVTSENNRYCEISLIVNMPIILQHCVKQISESQKLKQGTKFYVRKFHFKMQGHKCYANFTHPYFLMSSY